MKHDLSHSRTGQGGVAAVEFALIASVFFTLLIGIMEMSRVLFYMNTAAEVTRLGARMAVVCDVNASSPVIKSRMKNMLGVLSDGDILISYTPAGCTSSSCESVTVSVSKQINTLVPFAPFSVELPSFATTLPRESLSNTTNPMCS